MKSHRIRIFLFHFLICQLYHPEEVAEYYQFHSEHSTPQGNERLIATIYLERKLDFLARELLAIANRMRTDTTSQLIPVNDNPVLVFSPFNRHRIPDTIDEDNRRSLFSWSLIAFLGDIVPKMYQQCLLQSCDVHYRFVLAYEYALLAKEQLLKQPDQYDIL